MSEMVLLRWLLVAFSFSEVPRMAAMPPTIMMTSSTKLTIRAAPRSLSFLLINLIGTGLDIGCNPNRIVLKLSVGQKAIMSS
jgi:hypothetical protein